MKLKLLVSPCNHHIFFRSNKLLSNVRKYSCSWKNMKYVIIKECIQSTVIYIFFLANMFSQFIKWYIAILTFKTKFIFCKQQRNIIVEKMKIKKWKMGVRWYSNQFSSKKLSLYNFMIINRYSIIFILSKSI